MRLLSSPRRRRRLKWLAVVAVGAGVALTIGILYPNTNHVESVFTPGKPQVTHEEPPATPLSKRDVAATEKTLDAFVTSAVLRQHLERSYGLVTNQIRAGLALEDWRKGEISVVPFPKEDFAFAKSKLRYSRGNFARYDVVIWARPRAKTGSTMFSMELRAVGHGQKRRWLVAYWEPIGGGLSAPSNPGTNPLNIRQTREPSATAQPLGTAWVLAPLAVLSMIVLVPGGLAIRGWLRNRRADRDYVKRMPPPLKRPS
jgi:hypothetical protein